jgi:hypothetical protein
VLRKARMPLSHSTRRDISLPMAKKTVVEKDSVRQTGPAGPNLRTAYCNERCYKQGEGKLLERCRCKGCNGHAHGRGKKHALDGGYLRDSPPAPRKPKLGQTDIPFEEIPAPNGETDINP